MSPKKKPQQRRPQAKPRQVDEESRARSAAKAQAKAEERVRAARAAQRRGLAGKIAAVVVGLAIVVFAGYKIAGSRPGPIDGVRSFDIAKPAHVGGKVTYPVSPPVGGDHSPTWQNCGSYPDPIVTEQGVHSMEHGAVWVTYRPDLPEADKAKLAALAKRSYVLVSPFEGEMPSPVVASGWSKQIVLTGVDDPRLEDFVDKYREDGSVPEPGAACTGGNGAPA